MRDFKDPVTLSAELEGISCLVCVLYVQFTEEDRPILSNETVANGLFAIETYLERLSDAILDMDEATGKEVKTA